MAKEKYKEWIEPDGLLKLRAWARDGLSNEQIAHNCDIAEGTLYEWKKKYPEIDEALKKGKEIVDIEVENALNKRALGYQYTEEKVETTKDKDGNVLSRKVTRIDKHVSPDLGAIVFWLKNRKSSTWRDHIQFTEDKDEGMFKEYTELLGGLKENKEAKSDKKSKGAETKDA